jgi:hypothetical protein
VVRLWSAQTAAIVSSSSTSLDFRSGAKTTSFSSQVRRRERDNAITPILSAADPHALLTATRRYRAIDILAEPALRKTVFGLTAAEAVVKSDLTTSPKSRGSDRRSDVQF